MFRSRDRWYDDDHFRLGYCRRQGYVSRESNLSQMANLQKQYNEVNRILSQLHDSTENKNCEKYSCESVKCVTNSTGGPGTDRVKQSYTKTQKNTAKRRKKSSNNILSLQKTSGEKYN